MDDAWARLLALAEGQFGVVSIADAAMVGVPEHRVRYQARRGALERIRPEVFRVAGSVPTFRQRVKGVTLWLGNEASVSHATAARLARLDLSVVTRMVDVTVVGSWARGRRATDLAVHRTLVLPDHHRMFIDGINTTSAARTIVDVAGSLSDEDLEAAAESARRLGLMTISELVRVRDDCGERRRGRAQLARYIELHRGNAALDRRLEVKTADMLRRHRLDDFVPQHRVPVAPGRSYSVDFAWPLSRFAVECDSYRWHGRHAQWKRDRRRLAAIERAGWRVMFVTWDDATRYVEETIARIRLALSTVGT